VVGEAGEHLGSEPRGPVRAHDGLTPRLSQVLEAVPSVRAAPADSISRIAGVRLEQTQESLAELARGGLVTAVGRGWRLARRQGEEATGT
jgi:hypothetical protein